MDPTPNEIYLSSLQKKVELHLQEAIQTFQNLDEASLLKPSSNGGWSIAQCLEHLNSYGHYYLPHIKNGIAKHRNNPFSTIRFKSSWVGSYFTRMMDPKTAKKKLKAFKNHIPAQNLNAYTVVAEFIHQQEELLVYLEESKKMDLNKIKIPISIFKWIKLNIGDVFQFLVAHNERHLQQAKRNLI